MHVKGKIKREAKLQCFPVTELIIRPDINGLFFNELAYNGIQIVVWGWKELIVSLTTKGS